MLTPGVLKAEHLNSSSLLAVVHLATQAPGVLQQVTLRPDKIANSGQLIRLGETQGDEASCWIALDHVYVVEWLGTVDLETKTVTPFPKQTADVVHLTGDLAERVNAAA